MRLIVMAMLLATPALANGPREMMFSSTGICYLRLHSADHMASNPAQRVETIALWPDSESWDDPSRIILRLLVQLRSKSDFLTAYACCEDGPDAMLFGLEGGAGTFTLSPKADGGIVLDVGEFGMSFEGSQGLVTVSGTSGDDRACVMPPVPADACPKAV